MKMNVTLLVILLIVSVFADDNIVVKIKKGEIKGKKIKTDEGTTFYSFTGIPYARPPVGKLRFQPPKPTKSWNGTFDATKPHNVCPQIDIYLQNFTITGDEDCLYVNVYTPQLPQSEIEPLAVMFYIHGGGWGNGNAGSEMHGPDYFMDANVVLVTVNYRLGLLGFIGTGDEIFPGNNAMKDQAFAIKWTSKNIAKFGGDPKRITVFGQSSGGASAHYHMISPMSRDLISGVIAQSGSALSIWSLAPAHLISRRSKLVAGFCGCETFKINEMHDCLMQKDAYEIVDKTTKLMETDMDPLVLFKPVIEPPFIKDPFLNEDPIKTIRDGKAANIPIIAGFTENDGSIRANIICRQPELLQKFNENFSEIGPLVLLYGESMLYKNKEEINEKIRYYYFKDKPIDKTTEAQFAKALTDVIVVVGTETMVALHSKYSNKPVYYYLYGYLGSKSYGPVFAKTGVPEDYGVCHCNDLISLFKNSVLFPDYIQTATDQKVTKLMTDLWTNFAKYGNPTPEGLSVSDIMWEHYQKDTKKYYYINRNGDPSMAVNAFKRGSEFWKKLPLDSRRISIRDEL